MASSKTMLMDISRAKPTNEIKFPTKGGASDSGAGQRQAVDPDYLKKTRENDPWPAEEGVGSASVRLSECRFVTPEAELGFYKKFVCSCRMEVTGAEQPKSRSITFELVQVKDGKSEVLDKFDGVAKDGVAQVERLLSRPQGVALGQPMQCKLVARHSEASEASESVVCKIQYKIAVKAVEIAALSFCEKGVLPCLDSEGAVVESFASVILYANRETSSSGENNEGVEWEEDLVVFGHASGSEVSQGFSLSEKRAQAVKTILENDASGWGKLAKAHGTAKEMQTFLKSLAVGYRWDTDPGTVDGVAGAKTAAALKNFQKTCNTKYKLGLNPDGKCDDKTWEAFHRVLCDLVAERIGGSGNAPSWKKPVYGYASGMGAFPCGASFPDALVASGGADRVDLVFVPHAQLELEEAPSQTALLSSEQVVVYNSEVAQCQGFGCIVLQLGKAMAKTKVELRGASNYIQTSDDSGVAHFVGVAPGDYQICLAAK